MNKQLDKFNHVDLLYPSKYVKAADLRGKDVVVTIDDIEPRHELVSKGNRKEHKPVVYLRGKEKMWVLNKTNAKTIAGMYGNEVKKWIGKSVTLFPTTVQAGGQTHDCIRVRPEKPNGKQSEPASDIKTALDEAREANEPPPDNFDFGPEPWEGGTND